MEGKAVHITDVQADPEYSYQRRPQVLANIRTMLGVPLLREGVPIGVLALTRSAVRPFTEKQIELITTFADQAVIAIENVRLFEAEQQRTRSSPSRWSSRRRRRRCFRLSAALPATLEPVFATMLEKAVRICDAKFGNIYRWDGELAPCRDV